MKIKAKLIFLVSMGLSAYLLFHFMEDDSPVTYSWLGEQHILEAAVILKPVLPKLEDYFLNGKKRLPYNLKDVELGHLENISNNQFVAGLGIEHFRLVVRLKDADSNKTTSFYLTPQGTTIGIKWSCQIGNIPAAYFEKAFPGCIDPSDSPYGRLMDMVGIGSMTEAQKAIDKGADVNQIVEGRYPLRLAVKNKSVIITEFLIKSGANVNLVNHDDFGKTPLMYAIEQNDFRIINALVEHGADVNAKDSEGKMVIDYVDKQNYEVVDYLVGKGASVIDP